MAFVATIGFFDGVHSGHQFVLEQMKIIAQDRHMKSAVVIFEDHPQTVLHGKQVPLLTTFEERVQLLKERGIDTILSFRFEEICKLTAEEFIRKLHEQDHVEILVMGYDHHFGSDRLPSFNDYRIRAERVGVSLLQLPQNPLSKASSTAIRRELTEGNIEKANALLGYPYTLTGKVVSGKQIGRTIGFPTANLNVPEVKLVPKEGVYLCDALGKKAIMNIGTNPTLNGNKQTIELHIPDFSGNLYGKVISVKLLHYLRQEKHFDSIEDLRNQIEQDVQALRNNN